MSSCGRLGLLGSIFYVFFDNMEYCFLNGFLMVLLIQHCASEGKEAQRERFDRDCEPIFWVFV